MKGVVRISFLDGGLFLSARTAYERELLFEHIDQCTKRHGRISVELNRREWTVSLSTGPRESCTSCGRPLVPDHVTYKLGERSLCVQCARRDLR